MKRLDSTTLAHRRDLRFRLCRRMDAILEKMRERDPLSATNPHAFDSAAAQIAAARA